MTAWLYILAAVVIVAAFLFLTPYQSIIFGIVGACAFVVGWLL